MATGEVRLTQVGDLLAVDAITLRDYFAVNALPLAWKIECESPTGPFSEHMEPTYSGAATRAYYMADAMLKERAK
jgi:hypothetical protein